MIANFARYRVPKHLAHRFAAIFKSERLHSSYVDDTYSHAAALRHEEAEAIAREKLERQATEARIAAELQQEDEIARQAKISAVPEIVIPEVQGVPLYVETSYFVPIPTRKAPPPPSSPSPIAGQAPASAHRTPPVQKQKQKQKQRIERNEGINSFPVVIHETRERRERCNSQDSDVTVVPHDSVVRLLKEAHFAALPRWLQARRRKTRSL